MEGVEMMFAGKSFKKYPYRILVAALGIAIVLLTIILTTRTSAAATLTVDDDGGADFEKIQDAINASADGDTIRVWEGTYYENVVVNKSVSLIGNGSGNTTINASGSGDAIWIVADGVNLRGFNLTGSLEIECAGVKIESDYNIISGNTLFNNLFGMYFMNSEYNLVKYNCYVNNTYAGILFYWSNDSEISNNTCYGNKLSFRFYDANNNTIAFNECVDNADCSIKLFHSGYNTISSNNCSNRNELYEDGIYLENSNYNLISNNTCLESHTGIQVRQSKFNVLENNICSSLQWGIYLDQSDFLNISYNRCSNNYCGIRIDSSENCTITNNIISSNFVGIEFWSGSNVTIQNNRITNSEEYGIWVDYGPPDSIFSPNYWGHDTGPFHPGKNPEGLGDNVTDFVEFSPWLDSNGTLQYLSEDDVDEDSNRLYGCMFGILVLVFFAGCLLWPKKAKPGEGEKKKIDDVQLFSSYDPYSTRTPEVRKSVKKMEEKEEKDEGENSEEKDEDGKEEESGLKKETGEVPTIDNSGTLQLPVDDGNLGENDKRDGNDR
jgi:parallel beta-helix repeat protein